MVSSRSLPFHRVHIVGTGLLGTSIGLALRDRGVVVTLDDLSPTAVHLAADYGAGEVASDAPTSPDLVVVATPPDVTASVVVSQLTAHPTSLVIDVASVKQSVLDHVRSGGVDVVRYVGTHPMAGREKGGPTSARADLFTGRPWVVCAHEENSAEDLGVVEAFASELGGTVHRMTAAKHDEAVALMSHLPQLVSSVLASTLLDADDEALDLAGQGVRDVTRIAGSDSGLWSQILSHNAPHVATLARDVGASLIAVADALDHLAEPGSRSTLARALEAGAKGVAKLPGKHGLSERFAALTVIIDDRPGQLAQLLTDIGQLDVNLEDMRLEHSPGAAVGFVELFVVPDAVSSLATDLESHGWRIAGERS